MKIKSTLVAMAATLFLAACGSEQSPSAAGNAQSASTPTIGGEYRIDGPAPFNAEVARAQLRCQSATPGSPFRAQWQDPDNKTAVLVTGYPLDDGSNGTRVDNFQVVSFGANHSQKNADLAGAELSVHEVQKAGASSFYEVQAKGTFTAGGTFTASGVCRA